MNRAGKLGILVWALHLALPMLGLWLLIAQPQFDIHWQHEPAHFWLIAGFAAMNSVLGAFMSEAARRWYAMILRLFPADFRMGFGWEVASTIEHQRTNLPDERWRHVLRFHRRLMPGASEHRHRV